MSDKFPIEKGVKMPPPPGKCSRFPLSDMEVGDSFFVPTHRDKESARIHARVKGYKISTRAEKDGFRIWRIA